MLKSSLCDYGDAYTLVKGTISVVALVAGGGNNDKNLIFKNWAPFTDSISRINNTHINNAKHTDVVMPMYNSIECSDNYLKHQQV